MVEVLVAISLFALFFSVLIKAFRGGSESFNSGSWRLTKQKEAQIFLGRLKELLERANYAQKIGPDGDVGTNFQIMPIYVLKSFFNTVKSCSNENKAVMCFSILESYIEAQLNLGVSEKKGTWTGVSLICKDNKLTLKRTSIWNDFSDASVSFSAPADTHPSPDGCFLDGKSNVNVNLELSDITSLGIYLSRATDSADIGTGTMIIIELELSKFKGGKPSSTRMRESLKAKLIRVDHVVNDVTVL